MKKISIILIILFFCAKLHAHNPFWSQTDKKLITSVVRLNKYQPYDVETFFATQKIQKLVQKKQNLGFGWTMWETGIGGGYISISAKFFYYYDSLISYSLSPELPEEKGLLKRYKKWYGKYFEFSEFGILPYNFNESAILRPLAECKLQFKNLTTKVLYYMSPVSGIMYGYAGGGVILKNRKVFLELKDSLTNQEVIIMMYSINPASRLTAIEYYLKNRNKFEESENIDKWITQVFIEIPRIETMFGCFKEVVDTKSFLYDYLLFNESQNFR